MGGDCAPRDEYLRQLLNEFQTTRSYDAKCQVLANLSNFAYDPINFEYIRDIGILDAFIDQIRNSDDKTLTHFACSGICNLSLDPINAEYIINNDGINLLGKLLSSDHEETSLNALTGLIYLAYKSSEAVSSNSLVLSHVLDFQKSSNPRFKNLATIFLQDVSDEETVSEFRR